MKKNFAARVITGARLRNALARLLPREGVVILNYHRIGDGTSSLHDRALWSATEQGFDDQLAFLKSHCDVIALDDLTDALHTRGGRHVAITFDDGYLDNYELAFPALRRHGLPAAFFIATGFIDRPRLPWWDEIAMLVRTTTAARLDMHDWIATPLQLAVDREGCINALLRAYKQLGPAPATAFLERLREQTGASGVGPAPKHWMDWDMIREMAGGGMTIGGHTMDHPVLATLPASAQQQEITGCASRLQEELGQPMDYFAYPVGGRQSFNSDTFACLDQLGTRNAFSYYGGFATRRSHRYDLQRVAIEAHMGQPLFRAITQLPQVFCRRTDE
ncbi:polysaccharide deacetylase family protein [Luteimonas mephitis]|uniref:polysaccharide deacetylase family protein n=1 Tax=Luteimonas mephitis TaxID=83615 RepID=UPI003A957A93